MIIPIAVALCSQRAHDAGDRQIGNEFRIS